MIKKNNLKIEIIFIFFLMIFIECNEVDKRKSIYVHLYNYEIDFLDYQIIDNINKLYLKDLANKISQKELRHIIEKKLIQPEVYPTIIDVDTKGRITEIKINSISFMDNNFNEINKLSELTRIQLTSVNISSVDNLNIDNNLRKLQEITIFQCKNLNKNSRSS